MTTNPAYTAKVRPHGPIRDNQQPLQPERPGPDGFDPGEPGFERAAQDIVGDPDIAADHPPPVRARLSAASLQGGARRVKEQSDLADSDDLENIEALEDSAQFEDSEELEGGAELPDMVELPDMEDAQGVERVVDQTDHAPQRAAANIAQATGAGPEARRSIGRKPA
jgi:hypothetical protein